MIFCNDGRFGSLLISFQRLRQFANDFESKFYFVQGKVEHLTSIHLFNFFLTITLQNSSSIWEVTASITDDMFTRCSESSCECAGKLYHCPLCVRKRLKGMKRSKLKNHFATVHWRPRVTHLGRYNIDLHLPY